MLLLYLIYNVSTVCSLQFFTVFSHNTLLFVYSFCAFLGETTTRNDKLFVSLIFINFCLSETKKKKMF